MWHRHLKLKIYAFFSLKVRLWKHNHDKFCSFSVSPTSFAKYSLFICLAMDFENSNQCCKVERKVKWRLLGSSPFIRHCDCSASKHADIESMTRIALWSHSGTPHTSLKGAPVTQPQVKKKFEEGTDNFDWLVIFNSFHLSGAHFIFKATTLLSWTDIRFV